MIIPKSQLIANINNEIVDNGDGLISPYDVRHNLIDLIDSVHLLTDDNNLNALNFSTPATRSVKAGERTLEKLNLDGYFSVDNSAFGYAALKSNYQGVKNTAIGSQSLNCNIYGESNTALGVNALGGNTTGNGNVGLGNNTLINNKVGNFNIAIGHSAGYYVSRDTSYKLFVASHPVESDYICANPLGSGLVPLLHGDLSSNNLKLGIAVPTLYAGSTLQVSGGIGPYLSSIDDVGSNNYRFRNIFLSNGIQMPSGKSLTYSYSNGSFVVNNSLLPSVDKTYNLGSIDKVWNSGYFNDIYVSGAGYFSDIIVSGEGSKYIFDEYYFGKNIYFGSQTGVITSLGSFSGIFISQKVGSNIDINKDGTIIAFTSGTGPNFTGNTNVYKLQNNSWQKLGNTFNDSFGNSGSLISLNNNGDILAITNPWQEKTKVYQWDGTSWNQYGNDILTSIQVGNDDFIYDIKLNGNGNILANNYYSSGVCKIYKYESSTWSQLGNTIIPNNVDAFGLNDIAINNDGNRIAASYLRNSLTNSGIIEIYDYNSSISTWTNTATISGLYNNQFPYFSISFNENGNKLAIGDSYYGNSQGRVLVFEYNGSSWNQIGSTLYGTQNTSEYFGHSVSLNGDGTLLSVGGDIGKLYKWNTSKLNWDFVSSLNIDINFLYINKINKDGTRILNANNASNTFAGIVQIYNYSNIQSYANDESMNGAGLIVQTSGINYFNNYELLFKPKTYNTITSLETSNDFSRSSWNSNISFNIADGCHLKTQRVVSSGKLSLVTDPSGYGLFINRENLYLSRENIIPPLANPASGDISGLGQINFIKSTGICGDYNFTLGALESGIDISQKFINGLKLRNKDSLNNNKDKLRGFELKYYDDSDISYVGGLSDRFIIRSFNNTSDGVNNITLMKDDPNGGVFGINNFDSGGDNLFPKTILNIRSKDNAVARITAENASSGVHSALQLLGGSNCLQDGYETIYYHDSGIVDLNLYQDSGKLNIFRYTPFLAGLFSSGNLNATLTIGASGFPQAAISLRDDSFKTVNPALVATSGYGKIYNTKVSKEYANQSHALMFMDASGYIHPLSQNKYDVLDGSLIYSENYTNIDVHGGNTFGGVNCPKTRLSFVNSRLGNTAYGTYALYNLASGDRNTVIGFQAGSGINNGYNNVILGAYSAETLTSGDNNLILGTSTITHCSGYISKNIIIGNGISSNYNDNYKFLLGYSSNILISGAIGPSSLDKIFSLPNSGLLQVNNLLNTNYLKIRHNSIELYNQTSNLYPYERLNFNFATPSGSHTLVTFDYSVPSSGSGNYACSGLPYMQVNGNIKLLNNICFSDGTTLNSASQINIIDDLESSGITINNRVNNLFIEGIALTNLNPPSSSNNPTVGTIASKGINWSSSTNKTIVNRDTLLKINKNDYVIAIYINGEYRPIWVSSQALVCNSCNP
jgi:hypothetical protein